MLSPRSQALTRRNGASAACEPCRLRKLACDHGKPICARCVKRGKTQLCTYHPAPMAGVKRSAPPDRSASDTSRSRPRTRRQRQEPVHILQGNPEDQHGSEIASESSPQNGYLGSTSFISSLTESRQELEREAPFQESGANAMGGIQGIQRPVGSDDLQAGVCILQALYPYSFIDNLVERTSVHYCGPQTPNAVVKFCWQSLKEVLVSLEHFQDREQKLLELSKQLFRNTATALALPGNQSMRSWATSFTGGNLRWESVGVIVAAVGSQVLRLRDTHKSEMMSGAGDCLQTARWLAEACNQCLSFCDNLNQVNDMTLWTLMDSLILISQFYGDASYLTWKRLGDLSSAIFALGLHTSFSQSISSRGSIPRWLVQLRTELKYSAYHADLNLSMFMGRPPRLSSRYCSFESPPLELSSTELLLEPAELEKVIESLSPQGERSPRDLTLRSIRLREQHPMVRQREKILELCLGSPNEGQSRSYVESILQRSQQLWDSKCEEFRYDAKVWTGLRPPANAYIQLDMYLDHRYNDFLLQRVLVQRFHADPEQLLVIADELLANNLFLLGNETDTDVDWAFSLYSLPAAGVLAVELLKRQTQPEYRPSPRAPPRSRIVQNLSVLTAALKWVSHEGVGNYSLSRQAMSTLQRVLDRVLNSDCPPPPPPQNTSSGRNRFNGSVRTESSVPGGHRQTNHGASTSADGQGYRDDAAHVVAANVSDDYGSGGMDGLPWIGQMDFDEAFWLGLEEHPLLDMRAPEFGGMSHAGYT